MVGERYRKLSKWITLRESGKFAVVSCFLLQIEGGIDLGFASSKLRTWLYGDLQCMKVTLNSSQDVCNSQKIHSTPATYSLATFGDVCVFICGGEEGVVDKNGELSRPPSAVRDMWSEMFALRKLKTVPSTDRRCIFYVFPFPHKLLINKLTVILPR